MSSGASCHKTQPWSPPPETLTWGRQDFFFQDPVDGWTTLLCAMTHPRIHHTSMEEDDIIARTDHPPARVPVATMKDDIWHKKVIPTLISMILPTSKSRHIQGAMAKRLGLSASIPMAGENNLALLRQVILILQPIGHIHLERMAPRRRDMSIILLWIQTSCLIP